MKGVDFCPRADEEVLVKTKSSKLGLLATWLAIPAGLLVYFLVVYLPAKIRLTVSSAVNSAAMDLIGVSADESVDTTKYLFADAFGPVYKVFYVMFIVLFVVLVAVWFVACLIMTSRHLGYGICITNRRIVGWAKSEYMDAPLHEILNVHVEQSLWGKLFGYGEITVRIKRQTVAFKNIADAKRVYRQILHITETYNT